MNNENNKGSNIPPYRTTDDLSFKNKRYNVFNLLFNISKNVENNLLDFRNIFFSLITCRNNETLHEMPW